MCFWAYIQPKMNKLPKNLIKLNQENSFVTVFQSLFNHGFCVCFWYFWVEAPHTTFFQIQITPLFRRPQGPQGCLEKRNHPLSSNLMVWCAKIGPKPKKLWKTVKKPSFLIDFLDFMRFFEVCSIVAEY